MLIIDVGALGVGGNQEDIIYLIQPDPTNYITMANKILVNDYKNRFIFNIGLSYKNDVQTLNLHQFGEGHSFKERLYEETMRGSIDVATLTWDSFIRINNIDHVDLCVIDAEGSEQDILEGMINVLPNKIIIAGYHHGKFKDVESCQQLQERLINKGYRIVRVKEETEFECVEIEAEK